MWSTGFEMSAPSESSVDNGGWQLGARSEGGVWSAGDLSSGVLTVLMRAGGWVSASLCVHNAAPAPGPRSYLCRRRLTSAAALFAWSDFRARASTSSGSNLYSWVADTAEVGVGYPSSSASGASRVT